LYIYDDLRSTPASLTSQTNVNIFGTGTTATIACVDAQIDSQGDIHVVVSPDDSSEVHMYNKYDVGLDSWGTWLTVIPSWTETPNGSFYTSIDVDTNDYPVVMYNNYVKSKGITYSQMYVRWNTGSWQAPILVNDAADHDYHNPQIQVRGDVTSGGNIDTMLWDNTDSNINIRTWTQGSGFGSASDYTNNDSSSIFPGHEQIVYDSAVYRYLETSDNLYENDSDTTLDADAAVPVTASVVSGVRYVLCQPPGFTDRLDIRFYDTSWDVYSTVEDTGSTITNAVLSWCYNNTSNLPTGYIPYLYEESGGVWYGEKNLGTDTSSSQKVYLKGGIGVTSSQSAFLYGEVGQVFVADHEEGTTADWSSEQDPDGDLNVVAGSLEKDYVIALTVDDGTGSYVQQNQTWYSRYLGYGFIIEPNGAMGDGEQFTFVQTRLSGAPTFSVWLDVRRNSGDFQIRAGTYDDTPTASNTAWYTIDENPHWIEVRHKAESVDGQADGQLEFYIDGDLKETLSSIDDHSNWSMINAFRAGQTATAVTPTTGTINFDYFILRDDYTLIGSPLANDSQPAYLAGGIETSDNQPAYLEGSLGTDTSDSQPAYLSGQNDASDSQSSFLQGQDFASDNQSAYLAGATGASDSQSAYLKGSLESVDNTPAYTAGSIDTSDSQVAYLLGGLDVVDNQSAFLQGQDSAVDNQSAYLDGSLDDVDNQPAFLKGQDTAVDNQPAYTVGQDSAVDSQPAFLQGSINVSANQPAFLEGTAIEVADNQAAFLQGQDTAVDSQTAYLVGSSDTVDNQTAYLEGSIDVSDSQIAFLQGSLHTVNSQSVYLAGGINVVDNQPAYLSGIAPVIDSQEAYLKGQDTAVDSQPAYLKGQDTVIDNQPAFLVGGIEAADNQAGYLQGSDFAVDSQAAYLVGQDEAVDSQIAYTKGQDDAVSSIPAFLAGSIDVTAVSKSAYLKGQDSALDSQAAYLLGGTGVSSSQSAFMEGCGEYLTPDADISQSGSWKREDDSTSNLYLSIDEYPYDDSDYVWHEDVAGTEYFEVRLTDPSFGSVGAGDVKIVWRGKRKSGSETVTMRVQLRQGASTVIAQQDKDFTDTDITYIYTLSSGEKSSITDWTDLRLRFIVQGVV
jgi:hypothetical protein